MLPAVPALAGEQRGGDRLAHGDRRGLVHDELAHQLWRTRVACLQVGHPRHRLDDIVVHPLLGLRAGAAEPGHRHVDDVRVDRPELRLADPHSFGGARAEVLQEHVGGGAEVEQRLQTVGMFRVDRDRPLAAIDAVEQRAHRVPLRSELAHAVADAVGQLHLDHLGPLLGHDHPGHRSRDHLSGFDDSHSRERLHPVILDFAWRRPERARKTTEPGPDHRGDPDRVRQESIRSL